MQNCLIDFVGDDEVRGPSSKAERRAAYQVIWHVLGIGPEYKLSNDHPIRPSATLCPQIVPELAKGRSLEQPLGGKSQ